MYIDQLSMLFEHILNDDRITAIHVSLYLSLFQKLNNNNFSNPFPITRAEIMKLSKIHAKATYHKCMKELQQYGYIIYKPSFHPLLGSTVVLNKL